MDAKQAHSTPTLKLRKYQMKKSNPLRQQLLQRKRTKHNQSRKGAQYDPNKMERRAQAAVQAGTPSGANGRTTIVL
jgi:hypothetical protein